MHAKIRQTVCRKNGTAATRGDGVIMRKVKNVLKRTVGLALALALMLSVLPTGVFAAGTEDDPIVLGVSMNETRSYISVLFNRDVQSAVSNLTSKIKISTDGKALTSISSSSKVSIAGAYMYISLPYSLTTPNNYFSINAGTLVGQDGDIETPLFDARSPELLDDNHITLDTSEQTVTIKFKRGIKGFPNNSSLKNGYITLARSGSTFNEIIPADDISIDSEKGTITIYLENWLSGKKSRFRIAATKLQDATTGNINLTDITTDYVDASETSQDPEVDYIEVDSDRDTITIYFTAKIKNAFSTGVSSSVAETLLKSHIWLGRGSSSSMNTLGATDDIIFGSNYLRLTLDEPLTSNRNYLKIDGGSLTDYYGNYIYEAITTDNFTSGTSATSAKPVYASAFLSSSRKIVLYFTTPVQKNPKLTTSELRDNIKISRNGGTYRELTSRDTVSFSDNAMTITLSDEITGSNNRVKVMADTIASKSGLLLESTITTTSLVAGMDNTSSSDDDYDADAPEFSHITYDSSAQRVRIYFDRDIRKVSSADFYDDITISRNGGSYESLSNNDVITIAPANALTILLDTPLSGTRNSFRIKGNTSADDESGYVQNSTITTDNVSASGSSSSTSSSSSGDSDYSGGVTASISDDLYTITLSFDEAVYNNQDSLEDLKNKIQISRKGSFKTLSGDDYIRLDAENKELLIVLAEPANEYFSQIKILSGALRDASGGSIASMTTLPLGESEGKLKTYIDGIAVDGMATSEDTGTSTVATISGLSKFNVYPKAIELLVKVPSTQTSATFNLTGDIADHIKRYGGKIALSLGSVTYYLPASNISEIATSDTLSITINNSASATSQKLTTAASSDSFTIEIPAKALSAKVISASGVSKDIPHKIFADKRFMLTTPKSQTAFTAVRIEASGNIVPVPSSAEVKGGVVYVTGKTLEDGDYAAISSSRSLETLSWAQAPTNVLASRLILTAKNGSNLNGSEAISRSETVTILSRTLGILGDSTGASPFFDMISTDSYFNAVMSTVSYELISGYPDSTFKPSNTLTRAEAMTIVARAMRFLNGKSVSVSSDMSLSEATNILSKFTDANTVDNWAKVNIAECVQAGVVNGDNNGRLNPKAKVTRAELIQLMYNLLSGADMT